MKTDDEWEQEMSDKTTECCPKCGAAAYRPYTHHRGYLCGTSEDKEVNESWKMAESATCLRNQLAQANEHHELVLQKEIESHAKTIRELKDETLARTTTKKLLEVTQNTKVELGKQLADKDSEIKSLYADSMPKDAYDAMKQRAEVAEALQQTMQMDSERWMKQCKLAEAACAEWRKHVPRILEALYHEKSDCYSTGPLHEDASDHDCIACECIKAINSLLQLQSGQVLLERMESMKELLKEYYVDEHCTCEVLAYFGLDNPCLFCRVHKLLEEAT